MSEITGLLFVALGALADGEPVNVNAVLQFAEAQMTPQLVSDGVDLYELLCDVESL
ncbi:hypothetical protein [Mycobacterium sp. 852013-50091_SCH5140682]|uniref:hypothetical protein n=1 Tax=Mycobacterium sp. 852013-50091_SCH5140682 TaxID=1834109 RepID=UPI000AAD740B|nr:hypothetical protein [Mycobacterium sp. 852013-50091_SCH5140682]